MGKRGQNHEAWLARWRDGACPIHGTGFVVDGERPPGEGGAPVYVRCAREECPVRAARWPGSDEHHASFGLVPGAAAGDDAGGVLAQVAALLAKAGDVDAASDKPGPRARDVRVSYPLEEEPPRHRR